MSEDALHLLNFFRSEHAGLLRHFHLAKVKLEVEEAVSSVEGLNAVEAVALRLARFYMWEGRRRGTKLKAGARRQNKSSTK
jgi:transposase